MDPRFNVQVGEQRSRGVEFDVSAQPLRGWNLLSTFSYTKAEISRDTRFPVGNQILAVPRPMGSFWTTYEFDRGLLRGFGIGAGAFGVGRRYGDNNNSFTIPGYMRVDGSASTAD